MERHGPKEPDIREVRLLEASIPTRVPVLMNWWADTKAMEVAAAGFTDFRGGTVEEWLADEGAMAELLPELEFAYWAALGMDGIEEGDPGWVRTDQQLIDGCFECPGSREWIEYVEAGSAAQHFAYWLSDEFGYAFSVALEIDPMKDRWAGVRDRGRFYPPAPKPAEYVYAMRCPFTGFVKIGISRDPEERRKGMQTALPGDLELVETAPAPNGALDEQWLHRVYRRHHLRGEWFDLRGHDGPLLSPSRMPEQAG